MSLKNFVAGENIKASETNSNNNFLLKQIEDNGETLDNKIDTIKSNITSQIETAKTNLNNTINNKIAEVNSVLNNRAYLKEIYENGTSGFAVWSNGFCLQWGRLTTNDRNGHNVTYLKRYNSQNYMIDTQFLGGSLTNYNNSMAITDIFSNGFNCVAGFGEYRTTMWHTLGKLAPGQY